MTGSPGPGGHFSHDLPAPSGAETLGRPQTHHCDSIIQQRLPEDYDEQNLIDVDLLKHSQDGHWVHSGNQAAEQQEVQQPDFQVACETSRAVVGWPWGPAAWGAGPASTHPLWALLQAAGLGTDGLGAPGWGPWFSSVWGWLIGTWVRLPALHVGSPPVGSPGLSAGD